MYPFKSRKAVTALFTVIIAVVIVTIILILLIIIFDKIANASQDEALRTRCRTSLMAYAKIKNLPFGDANADEANIDCPTRYTTIPEGNQNAMRREVANLLVGCWSDFGQGKVSLFSVEDEKFCVICSVFQFEDRSVRLTGLPSFMMTEPAPIIVNKKHPTYQEYVTGVRTDAGVVDQARGSIDNNFFDGSKRYAVMFTYYKQSYWNKIEGGFLGLAVGVVGGVIGVAVAVGTFGAGFPVSAMIFTGSAAAGVAIGAAFTGEGQGGGWTTSGADWDANIVVSEYIPDQLRTFGCQSLPVSQVDERFK